MKLVAGLGNPGDKYRGTRHNIGFEVLHAAAAVWNAVDVREGFHGRYASANVSGEKILLLWPMTFMNVSGQSVLAAKDFYKIATADVMVVCDDLALAPGKIRIRSRGSSGGQKGLADILRRLGSEETPRLRVGIGSTPPGWDTADYVLSRFGKDEETLMQHAVKSAVKALEVWIDAGIAACMNQFNA